MAEADTGGLADAASFARPKSRILRRPLGATRMFSGFRSRWAMPRSWAASSPRAIRSPEIDSLAERHAPLRQVVAQGLPVEQFRDDEVDVVVLTDVEHRQDVRMVQRIAARASVRSVA